MNVMRQNKPALSRVACVHFLVPMLIEGDDIVRLSRCAVHAGRTDRHARYRQPNYSRTLFEQPIDFANRHMTFYDIAIHDGCMAGLELEGNLVSGLDGGHILHILHGCIETIVLDILHPVAATASGGRSINGDLNSIRVSLGASCQDEDRQGRHHEDPKHFNCSFSDYSIQQKPEADTQSQ